ncbi:class I SAM-dependent methyltransferase [Paractinoplanes durhamensis]|uniref:Methyltransferase type 11 domain-containing protein n=1 Tax=Paractinoplanes durhamensis TaxID=113563 RepID=A0ABQ3YQP9_9ACTN|nr:class I SAM-dependent methyltransferase [Actinoplanes durhamensis]GID99911.1 hypothetical protein Adu01nite_12620 [Actinoplanes durhamensis]
MAAVEFGFDQWGDVDAVDDDAGQVAVDGRVAGLARAHGFADVVGVGTSPGLVERARRDLPDVTFRVLAEPPLLPWADASFDAVLLLAVLTCVPSDAGQRRLVGELARVLRPGGVLYVSDLVLQSDERSLARYRRDAGVYGTYGVFEVGDGVVCRHHRAEWLRGLLEDFSVVASRALVVESMNGHPLEALQLLARLPDV